MKSLNLKSVRFLPMLAVLFTAFFMYSCAKEDIETNANGSNIVAAAATGFGHCPECPLPPGISGGLPGVLMANDDILNAIKDCYNQTPATVCHSGEGVLQSQTMNTSATIYLAGSLWGGNVWSHHCNFAQQLASAASSSSPGPGWLMKDVTNIVHLGSGNFRVYATWQKYLCGENGDPQLPKLP